MSRSDAALRHAAEVVDVPGAPLTLRLDEVGPAGGRSDALRLVWSYEDPEYLPDDHQPHGRRIRGTTEVAWRPAADARRAARDAWAAAQLAAAHRFKNQVDADSRPGEPWLRRSWTTTEAWLALRDHLAVHGQVVTANRARGEIAVGSAPQVLTYRVDAEAWATYLNRTYQHAPSSDGYIVPTADRLVDGLPQWAADELMDVSGGGSDTIVFTGDRWEWSDDDEEDR
ncbi:hypothetical protein [Nocardioides nanhaiensis]|uniref:hypothetical protein n=1 Tax=Nocardioides nanhaiensis TaxID=1476871 RepID=UPI0031E8590E